MRKTMLRLLVVLVLGPWLMPVLAEPLQVRLGDLRLNANLEGAEGASTAWLVLHGTRAHAEMEIVQALQAGLAERGHASLAPTLSLGIDDRRGFLPCSDGWAAGEGTVAAELDRWIGVLKARGFEHVNLLGHSRGAVHLARYASAPVSPVVGRLVLLGPPVLAGPEPERAPGCAGDRLESLPSLADVQLRTDVVLGSDDAVARWAEENRRAAEARSGVRTFVIDGADHFFRDLYLEDVLDLVVEPAVDLSRAGDGDVLVVYVARRGCPYCRRMEMEVLQPLIRSGALPEAARLTKILLDDAEPMFGVDGASLRPAAFAARWEAEITPTFLFLRADGTELHPPIVGYPGPEFYSARLERAIYKAVTSPHLAPRQR